MHNKDILEKYNYPVPRYTSYPPATHFHNGVTSSDYISWLENTKSDSEISVYFHLPFCKSLCWYCGCNMKVSNSTERMGGYISTLIKEMAIVTSHLPKNIQVKHIHFGGGTPTYMPVKEIDRLFTTIKEKFDILPNAEIAVEIDPRTCTKEMVKTMAHHGVNRASLGVQDTNINVQEAINRIQPVNMVQECVEHLRLHGIQQINFDLIYGLPNQTEETITQTMRDVKKLNPSRIALFGYAHVPWMKKHQQLLEKHHMPNKDERHTLNILAENLLNEAGFVKIGLDHFAKPDDPLVHAFKNKQLHRNFQGYTTDTSPILIGFGASSISQTEFGIAQNNTDIPDYEQSITNNTLPIARGYTFQGNDIAVGQAIEQLMCYFEADLSQLNLHNTLDEFKQDGLITNGGNTIIVTEEGKPLIRNICAALDPYFNAQPQRHAQAI